MEKDFFKQLWEITLDKFGPTILHPQFFLKSYEHQAIQKAKRYARGTVVDIGCGRQIYRKELEPFIERYLGVDHPKISQKYQSKIKPEILADATNIPLPDDWCDVALMISVLEHLPNPQMALNEALRILKKNGVLILVTVQNYPIHDTPYDYFRYSRFGLLELLKTSGFKILSLESLGNYPILAGQYFNVFLLYLIKAGVERNVFTRAMSILAIAPVLLLCLLSNIFVYLLSQIVQKDKKGAFALYNLAVARKV